MNNKNLLFVFAILLASFAVMPGAYAFSFPASDGGISMFAVAKNSCTDTDGGKNVNLRGTTTAVKNFVATTYSDYCNDTKVIEYYCTGVNAVSYSVNCNPGYYCSVGACTKITCTDSDGSDIKTKGTVTRAGANYVDYCLDQSQVTEYTCSGTSQVSTVTACPSGSTCKDGACVQKTCTDSDGGKVYGVKGTVSDGTSSFTDSCNSLTSLSEYYCDGSSLNSESTQCAAGTICQDGACVNANCADSDGGLNFDIRGTASNILQSSTDACSGNTLTEYYCDKGFVISSSTSCESGSCTNGACDPITCTDSDGSDTTTKGTVTRNNTNYVDACFDSYNVNEFTCSGTVQTSSLLSCLAGRICKDGACVPITCTDSDNGQEIGVRGTCDCTNGTSLIESCYGTGGVNELYMVDNTCIWTTAPCPGGQYCTDGACAPLTCSDSDSGKIYLLKGTASTELSSYTDTCNENNFLTEYFCSGSAISSENLPCSSGYICTDGACVNAGCTDSDNGINYLFKGTTSNIFGTSADTCTGNVLTEYYCENGYVKGSENTCSGACSDGACIVLPPVAVCTDSDNGRNYDMQGTITDGTLNFTDYCDNETSLKEYYCEGSTIISEQVAVLPSYMCQNGARVEQQLNVTPTAPACGDGTCDISEDCASCTVDCGACPVVSCVASYTNGGTYGGETCSDTDGAACVNPNIVGVVTWNDGISPLNIPDRCNRDMKSIKEAYCSADKRLSYYTYACPAGTACKTYESGLCVPVQCGNGKCELSESCYNCVSDCGTCPSEYVGNIQIETAFCTDTDGGADIYHAGTILADDSWEYLNRGDYCTVNTGKLIEHACKPDTKPVILTIDCPAGSTCQNGACTQPAQYTCSDSDGGKVAGTKGAVSGIAQATLQPYTTEDNCFDSTKVNEMYCLGASPWRDIITCPAGSQCVDGACTASAPSKTCTDTDGGNFAIIKGSISGVDTNNVPYNYSDACVNSSFIMEYICNQNTNAAEGHLMECIASHGQTCSDGVCTPIRDCCTDTDGADYYTKGTTTLVCEDPYTMTDHCSDSNTVAEGTCELSTFGEAYHLQYLDCPAGYSCSDGTCVSTTPQNNTTITCTDSDGGTNWGVKGTTTRSNGETYTDACGPTSGTLNEYSCKADGTILISSGHLCGTGNICTDGACVSTTPPTQPPANAIQPASVSEPNGNGATILSQIQGDDSTWNSNWVVCGPSYLGGTPMTVTYPLSSASSGTLEFESTYSASNALMDISCKDSSGTDNYLAQSWLPPNGVNTKTIPGACLSGSSIGITWARTGVNCLKFDYMWVKTSTTQPPAQPISCTDTDGGQVAGVFGYTYGVDVELLSYNLTDNCKDTANLYEYYCDGTREMIATIACPSGYTCSNGACIASQNQTQPPAAPICCADTDGYNIYSKGTTSWKEGGGCYDPFSVSDYCTGSVLSEGTCANEPADKTYALTGSSYGLISYTCPYGCSNGACLASAPQNITVTCTDSDGGSVVGTKGTCTCTNGTSLSDSCSGSSVKEVYAIGSVCAWDILPCPSGQSCSNGACVTIAPPANQTTTASCTDSDGGNVTSIKGTASGIFASNGAAFSLTDSCASGTLVAELYCGSDLMPRTATLPCPSGQSCTDGACVTTAPPANQTNTTTPPAACGDGSCNYGTDSCLNCASDCGACQVCGASANVAGKSQCTDSDGGLDIYVKGNFWVNYATGVTYTRTDECRSGLLREWGCVLADGTASFVDTPCPAGTACVDGVCK